MGLIYKPQKSTIANKEGKKQWFPSLVKTGIIVDTQKLGENISESTSLCVGDVHNVVRSLLSVMRQELLNSNSVRLDGIGTFTMIARSRGKGVDTAKEVNPNQITALRCHFTPEYSRQAFSGTTRAMTLGVKFVHLDALNGVLPKKEDNPEGGGEKDPEVDPSA